MFFPRFVFAFTSLSSLLFVASSAQAAPILAVAGAASLPRLDANGEPVAKRPVELDPEAINGQDCFDDQRIRFPLVMSDFQANATVEAWASPANVDCSSAANRTGPNAECWKVAPPIPLQPIVDVVIPVRTLLAPPADAIVCGRVDLTTIAVQFMMFDPGNLDAPSVVTKVEITADTVGPPPPLAIVSPGNGRAKVDVAPPSDMLARTAVIAFCDLSSPADTCSSTALVPGGAPDATKKCGTVVGARATLFTDPLPNGVKTVIAVAARDSFGNVGPLSALSCTTPDANAEQGAESSDAGGGGCATGGERTGTSAPLSMLALFGFCVVLRRRRPR